MKIENRAKRQPFYDEEMKFRGQKMVKVLGNFLVRQKRSF